jgi:hypothetical protein
MKALPLPTKVALVASTAVVCVFAAHSFAQKPATKYNAPFIIHLGQPVKIKADKAQFEAALKKHTKDKKSYNMTYDGAPVVPSPARMSAKQATQGDNQPIPTASAAGATNITQNAGFKSVDDLRKFLEEINVQ